MPRRVMLWREIIADRKDASYIQDILVLVASACFILSPFLYNKERDR